MDNWEKRIEKMLMIMSNDQEFYMRTIHATPKSFIDPCFAIFKNLFLHAIHVIDENDYVDDQEEEFISEFLAQGCVGCIISWVDKGMKMTPIDLSSKLKKIEADMEQLKKQKRKLKALR
nr:TetR-like C-terminal domain-containing protein [Traorella massiliensis]